MSTRAIPINLHSLIELSARLNERHERDFILNASLLTLMGKLTISSGCVFVPGSVDNFFELAISKGRFTFDSTLHFYLSDFLELDNSEGEYKHLHKNGIKYLIPIINNNELVAVFGLGKRIIEEPMGDTEILYSKLVASITVIALEVAEEHYKLMKATKDLENRNLTLKTLFEITKDFSANLLNNDQILKMLSYHLMGQLMVSKYAIYRVKNETEFEIISNKCDIQIREDLLRKLLDEKGQILRNDNTNADIREIFNSSQIELISPMFVKGEIKGFLFIGKRLNDKPFTNEHKKFVRSLGNIAISALENERLFRKEVEMNRLEREIEIATKIQEVFLPKKFPKFDNLEIDGLIVPARHVGGDYYDFIELPGGKLIVVVADVSGKGVAASLIMANLQAAIRVVADIGLPLIEIINHINKVICKNTGDDKFVTLFIGILDLKSMKFEYINAGHNPPIVFNSSDEQILLKSGGLPLGIFLDEFDYETGDYQLKKNDLLVFYTDGITEAKNVINQEFGEYRLISTIKDNMDESVADIINQVNSKIKEFAGSREQYDDITITAMRYK